MHNINTTPSVDPGGGAGRKLQDEKQPATHTHSQQHWVNRHLPLRDGTQHLTAETQTTTCGLLLHVNKTVSFFFSRDHRSRETASPESGPATGIFVVVTYLENIV